MKNILYSVISLVVLCSCNSSNVKLQQLPLDTMKVIIWEIMTTNEWNIIQATKDTLHKNTRNEKLQLQKIFYLHHISKKQFYDTYQTYEQRPDKMKILLDSLTKYGKRQIVDAPKYLH